MFVGFKKAFHNYGNPNLKVIEWGEVVKKNQLFLTMASQKSQKKFFVQQPKLVINNPGFIKRPLL